MSKPEPLFNRLALIGIGLIGSSIARAARAQGAARTIVATARSPKTRRRVAELGIADQVVETNAAAVAGADLVIVCVPVGACGAVAKEIGPHLPPAPSFPMSDRSKARSCAIWRRICRRRVHFIPAHPVAGTEYSGPDAGFAELFVNRWCILTPPDGDEPNAVEKLAAFWRLLGANVEIMAPDHHDLVLAITSHLPHLIAYTIVGTADELQSGDALGGAEILGRRFPRLHPHRCIRPDDVARRVPCQQGRRSGNAWPLQRRCFGADKSDQERRRGGTVRALRAHARHSQGHRRDRSGIAVSRFRSPASRTCRTSRCRSLTPRRRARTRPAYCRSGSARDRPHHR